METLPKAGRKMNLAYLLLVLPGALALPNGLAPTPQMG
eukprot:COSAG05_NODE_5278_length_1217_cov_1.072451_1_plen_37_part_10